MSINPKILKGMAQEDAYLQSHTKGARRIKLERGQNLVVRFLPARLGPDGLWFARVARHWVNKVPTICLRNTAADFGGDPEYDCPLCDISNELNESSDAAVSRLGYEAKATPQFLTYCVLLERDGVQLSSSEMMVPWEFWMYRSTWEELKNFYIAGGRKSADSVLDYVTGNDFSVSKSQKGVRLDKLDAAPLFDMDPDKFEACIRKLEAAMVAPKVVKPTPEQVRTAALKLQDSANSLAGDDSAPVARGRRAVSDDDESSFRKPSRTRQAEQADDIPYDYPKTTARSTPAARNTRSAQVDDPEPEAEAEPEEVPAARAPRKAVAPARSVPAVRARAEADDAEPSSETEAEPAESSEQVGYRPLLTDRQLASRAAAASASAQKAKPAPAPSSDDDDDNLPEDDKDNVPPADSADAEADTPPPVVARKGNSAGNIAASIRSRLSAVKGA